MSDVLLMGPGVGGQPLGRAPVQSLCCPSVMAVAVTRSYRFMSSTILSLPLHIAGSQLGASNISTLKVC